ncbi:type II secretion system protein [Actinocrispum sp. NPDC049592]|uniref:type IV pilus modification PilV family protein n=1 Tax=Actinocrispum sp. NPDC049592 TaxID=3154835 RepID=UPI003418C089
MRSDESGETLLELVIAVVIMGIALVAIIGGLTTSVLVSDVHRKQSTAGAYARDYSEAIERAVASGGYVACASAASYSSPAGFTVPAGFSKSVVAGSLRYWNSGWQTSCGTDTGVQQLTVRVASDDGRAAESVVVVLRKPCRLSDSLC